MYNGIFIGQNYCYCFHCIVSCINGNNGIHITKITMALTNIIVFIF